MKFNMVTWDNKRIIMMTIDFNIDKIEMKTASLKKTSTSCLEYESESEQ